MTTEPEELPASTRAALDALLQAAVELTRVAEVSLSVAEAGALHAALDAGRVQLVVTMALPSGAVRVGIAGAWSGSTRELWELIPQEHLLQRTGLS